MTEHKITIRLNSDLKTRDDARLIRKQIDSDCDFVTFDFSDVNFMGRSFADEFYNLFIKPSRTESFRVRCIKESDSVQALFKVVKSTQQKAKTVDHDYKEIIFSNVTDLNKFLYAL